MDEQQTPAPVNTEPQVFTPTDAAAQDAPIQTTQIQAQSGGADVREPALGSPLVRIVAWLFSGFVVLFSTVIINVVLSLAIGRNTAVNIVSYILGLVGVVLLFVGPYKAVKIFLQNK